MYNKKCRCGKIEMNFYRDIGPFFIQECCVEAGYDHHGNLKKAEDIISPAIVGIVKSETYLSEDKETKTLESQEETLAQMTTKELMSLAASKGIQIKRYTKKPDVIAAILNAPKE